MAPSAAADAKGSSSFADDEIAHDAPTSVPLTVEIGCDLAITSGGGTVTVTMEELPEWLTATTATFDVDPMSCIPSSPSLGNVSQEVTLQVTPSKDAPGLVPASLNATVRFTGELRGNATAGIEVPPVVVKYRPGHSTTPEDMTFTVPPGAPYTFDLVIDVTANARTMVMFEDKKLSDPAALLNGLKAETYDVAAGKRGETRKVTFTPPEDPSWERVVVTFRTFSHCLDGDHCPEEMQRNVTWTFVNQQPGLQTSTLDEKDAPALPMVLVAAGLVALAAMVRRRQ
jgi:hypothetical protein